MKGELRATVRAIARLIALAVRISPVRAISASLLLLASQLAGVAMAWAVKLIVDATLGHDERSAATGVAVLAAVTGVSVAASWASLVIRTGLNERVVQAVESEVVEITAGAVGIEHYERPEYLDRVEQLRQSGPELGLVPDRVATMVAVLARLALTVGLLVAIAPALGLLPLFAVPALAGNAYVYSRKQRAWNAAAPLWRSQFVCFELCESEAAGREIRVFGAQDPLSRRFRDLLHEADTIFDRAQIKTTAVVAVTWVIFGVGFVVAVLTVARAALRGEATTGDLVLALTLGAQLNAQMANLVAAITSIVYGLHGARQYVWLRDYGKHTARPRAPHTTPRLAPARLDRGVRFDRVSFTYPGTTHCVLEEVDLFLPAGTTVAIVGDNGAGKTTLVKLLARMYEPTAGRIFIDDLDLATIDAVDWRSRISAAFQDFARFEFTAQRTVGAGDLPRLDDQPAAVEALERGHSIDVVRALPDGLDTQLGRRYDDGSELSGGQWQKLAVGRAMMRPEPLLLLLDEPTAALDAPTEAALFDRYAAAARQASRHAGAITLLVSHRLSTVRVADLILLVHDHRVAESGSHRELMDQDGLYAHLYRLQAAGYR